MGLQPVTVALPDELYDRLRRRARQTRRTVEAELVEAVATAIPAIEELPSDLADALKSLQLLDDAALWRSARAHLPSESAERLESLHLKRQREGLTADEESDAARLLALYERYMLVRAESAA